MQWPLSRRPSVSIIAHLGAQMRKTGPTPTLSHQPYRVMVACNTRFAFGRDIVRGVAAYAERHGPWDCEFNLIDPFAKDTIRRAALADGLIIHTETKEVAEAAKRLRMPMVAVGVAPAGVVLPKAPRVCQDTEAVGILAAEHLMACGFRRFAYCAFHGSTTAILRGRAFVRALELSGFSCDWLQLKEQNRKNSWQTDHAQLVPWVKALPKPVAMFTVGDLPAREVAMACRAAGISVPHEVAIIGTDNDEFVGALCSPQLSSIDTDCYRVGFEAAGLLQRILQGEVVAPGVTLVPPKRVVVRESTDVVAVENQQVMAAVEYIRENLAHGISVKQLVKHIGVARRTLEVAFRRHLHRSVHSEVVRAQVHRVSQFLSRSDLSLARIAAECGMRHRSHLNKLFKKATGLTPLEYRTAYRMRGG